MKSRIVIVPRRAVPDAMATDGADAIGPFSDWECAKRFLARHPECHGWMGYELHGSDDLRRRFKMTNHVDPRTIDPKWCTKRGRFVDDL